MIAGMTTTLTKEVQKLSMEEKIRLAEDLWDDIAAHGADLPVPHAHKRELDARLAAHLNNPDSAISLNEFRKRLAKQL